MMGRTATAYVPLLKDHQVPSEPSSRKWRAPKPLDHILGTSTGQWCALLVIGVVLVASGSIIWSITGGDDDFNASWGQSIWFSWCLFIDPGTQTGVNVDDATEKKIFAAVFSTAGFLFNLAVLGKMVDLIRGQLQFWQQTRNRVMGTGHTVILGWGEKTLFLLAELLHAYEQQAALRYGKWFKWMRRRVVIVAKRPEMEMAQLVKLQLSDQKISARGIQFREGNPADRQQLIRAGAPRAADVIVMGTSPSATKSDQGVLRVVMALAALPDEERLTGELFAEVRLNQNVVVVQEILKVADGIVARQAVNRTICLCSLVPVVGLCYVEMMSFKLGNHLFVEPAPAKLCGTSFAQACQAFPHSVVLGLAKGSGNGMSDFHEQASTLVPQTSQVIERGDSLVLLGKTEDIEKDDRANTKSAEPVLDVSNAVQHERKHQLGRRPSGVTSGGPKTVVLIGCPLEYPDLLGIMDLYLTEGSTVHILSEKPEQQRIQTMRVAYATDTEDVNSLFRNLHVKHYFGPTTSMRHLKALPLQGADCVIILAEHSEHSDGTAEADSRNLTTIITLRGLPEGEGVRDKCTVVCELLDIESEKVVKDNPELKRHGIYFSSNSLETAVFAMAAECKAIYNILMLLLQPQSRAGDIVQIPAADFVNVTERLTFFDLHTRVWDAYRGVLMGWRRGVDDPLRNPPVLNPQDKEKPLVWNQDSEDVLIVLLQV